MANPEFCDSQTAEGAAIRPQFIGWRTAKAPRGWAGTPGCGSAALPAGAAISCAFRWTLLLTVLLALSGCSIRKMAVNKLGNALAGSGTTFASDNDPDLIAAAVPFSLKLMESLLAENPNHQGLLLVAARGFTQYAYLTVQEPADELDQRYQGGDRSEDPGTASLLARPRL